MVVLAVNNGMQARKVIADSLSLSLYRHAPLKGWRATFYRDKHRAYEARRPPSDTLLSRASLRLFLFLRIFTMRFHDRDLTAPRQDDISYLSPFLSRVLIRVSRGIYSWKIMSRHIMCVYVLERKRLLKSVYCEEEFCVFKIIFNVREYNLGK